MRGQTEVSPHATIQNYPIGTGTSVSLVLNIIASQKIKRSGIKGLPCFKKQTIV